MTLLILVRYFKYTMHAHAMLTVIYNRLKKEYYDKKNKIENIVTEILHITADKRENYFY